MVISIALSLLITFFIKDIKIKKTNNDDGHNSNNKISRNLFNRIGSSRSLMVYNDDEIDKNHKYTLVKRYDIIDYSDSHYRSIRELHGINTGRKPTTYIPYCESTEYKVSFKEIKILAFDISSGKPLKVECCHADVDEKLNTHSFRIIFDKPLHANDIFQIAYYIEFPHELDCLSDTEEIMSLSLVRIKKKISKISFYTLLSFSPKTVRFYKYTSKQNTTNILPENVSINRIQCNEETLGLRNDILSKFPIDKDKFFYKSGFDIMTPKDSMYIIEYLHS